MFRKIAVGFIKAGSLALQNSFKLKPTEFPRITLRGFLNDKNIKSISLSDEKYKFIDWETWKKIIEIDWVSEKKYITDVFDCDNFAFSFSARMSSLFRINTAGVVYGIIYNKDTGNKIGGHAYNAIIAYNKNGLELYFYEAQTDKWIKFEKGKDVIIGNWRYVSTWILLY